jgi:hypothetical protein
MEGLNSQHQKLELVGMYFEKKVLDLILLDYLRKDSRQGYRFDKSATQIVADRAKVH